jgi:hypothetical protein
VREERLDQRLPLHELCHWSAAEAIGRGHDIRTVPISKNRQLLDRAAAI